MGIHIIKMPDIGEGIAEVELVAWHVKPGDAVVEDQALADVMTDKASVEIPSPVAGTVLSLGGEVGQMLAVGSELIRIETGAGDGAREETAAAQPAAPKADRSATPSAAAAMPMHVAPEHSADRPRASPSVRRRASELDLDLREVAATGPAGRIVHADLDAAVAAKRAPASSRPAARPMAPPSVPADDEQAIPVIGVRRKIAQKMQESKRRIPHFTYVEEVDVTELEDLRTRLNSQWAGQRPKLTLLPFLLRAVVRGVREFPQEIGRASCRERV